MTNIQPCVLSAFSGAGGLDLGFEAAGFRVLLCIERERWSRATLRRNRPHWHLANPGDIEEAATTLTPRDLGLKPGELSALLAGPPCQPFSKAAQWTTSGRSGMNDPRARCILSLLDLVERFLPAVLFLENVAGFSAGETSARMFIQDRLEAINKNTKTQYRLLEPAFVNAADYGIPQKRQRAFLIALRDNNPFTIPPPTHRGKPVTAWDAIGHLSGFEAPKAGGRWSDLLPSIPEGKNYIWHTQRGGGVPIFGYRTRYWSFLLKLEKSSPSWTLSAAPGPSTGPFHWENRRLAIEEAMRLQTFPEGWEFEGHYRTQMRQVGNATPPLLAEHFARALGKQVFGLEYTSGLLHVIQHRGAAPPPEAVAPVPTKYLHNRPTLLVHPGTGKGPKPTGTLKERLKKEEVHHDHQNARTRKA